MTKIKETIIAKDKHLLKSLISTEMMLHGNNCNLNHIDMTRVKDLSWLFYASHFNGDISQWNVSNVNDMTGILDGSKFNGDISNWKICTQQTTYFLSDYQKRTPDKLGSIFWILLMRKEITCNQKYRTFLNKHNKSLDSLGFDIYQKAELLKELWISNSNETSNIISLEF